MPQIIKATGNTQYKDSLFRFIFGSYENRKYLLSLCNALAGTNYNNPNDIEITTLNDVLYIKIKNDLSFILGTEMSLYEHQSSFNPNMPLRGLEYFAELYAKYIEEHNLNVYSSSIQKIPTPRYVVFYNGLRKQPDEVKLRLSDAFQKPDTSGEFEWTATMLNINYGHNRELMEKCKPLQEYSEFIQTVREYSCHMGLKDAIDMVIDNTNNWKYIGEFLKKCKSEVGSMLLTEFNQKLYEQELLEEGKKQNQIIMVRNLIKNAHLSPTTAMNFLEIPIESRDYILSELQK